ncbi:MAG: nitrogen fixation protein NifH [Anaerolineae bacterium CG03_land_8_20_14_0_80_58_20]|nr:MAG: nitrogen fixation protein NifH [Anaerolineae bacterium CG03_land_8_20_14_0_80_58_20]
MSWQTQLRGDSVSWLLESDSANVRYLAMRDLLDLPTDDKKLKAARKLAHKEGPIAHILSKMQEEGYWQRPGTGYGPKYKSTVWALILLAQLGASVKEDKRIKLACKYYLDHALNPDGQISAMTNNAPSGTIDCLQGNMLWSLMTLGYEDKRMDSAYEWMARTLTGEGVAPITDKHAPVRYYGYKCGPTFACGASNKLPCAWGGVKVMLAFARLPVQKRSALIKRAIRQGVDFFFSVDPSTAKYPNGWAEKPSGNWWKFGFPVFYVTDILQIAEALVGLGYGRDPRLASTLELVRSKQDDAGRWPLEYNYDGKTWMRFGKMKEPNPWVTLRALRVLKAAS